jgi:TonB family protein
MKYVRLSSWGLFLVALCAGLDSKAKAQPQPVVPPMTDQAAAPSSPEKGASDLARLAAQVQPAVVLVTVFDPSGKLLRSGTGFFVSDTGRIITTLHTMEGAANAVAKTADNGLYNITGIRSSSMKLDLAVVDAEVKKVPFLPLSTNAKVGPEMPVAVIGSRLAGTDGAPLDGRISSSEIDESSNALDLRASVPAISLGAPVVDQNGEVIGVVTAANGTAESSTIVRPVRVVESLIEQAQSNATAYWSGEPRPTPTPRARLVYAPPPVFPAEGRARDRGVHSGRYRLNFDATGAVKSIQVLQSTGSEFLDRAAINGLQQWKSQPGRESYVIVPLTFQSR